MSALPPVAVVVRFIDRINHNDVEGLGRLMTDDHRLQVHDEPPVEGRDANLEAWRGYCDAWPGYTIDALGFSLSPLDAEQPSAGDRVVTWGVTTGSHLGLPDAEERKLGVIWVAEVVAGRVRTWQVLDDTDERRQALEVPAGAAKPPS